MSITTILLLIALVCFILAAFKVAFPRVDLIGLGLAFVTAANLVRVWVFTLAILFLAGCALSYETAKGSKWSVGADPDAKQIRAASRFLF